MNYPDAAQLCIRLYCTVDGVPQSLCPLTKEVIADAFAQLARIGWVLDQNSWMQSYYGAQFHAVTVKGHWVEVIAAIFKKGPDVVDMTRGEELARQAGRLRLRESLDMRMTFPQTARRNR